LLGVFFFASGARAGDPAVLPEGLFAEPAFVLGVPERLLKAISRVESGIRPWTLNIDGRGVFFDSKVEAVSAARVAMLEGSSVDFGLMQVNSFWLRKYGLSPEAVLDPLANVYFGAWILSEEYRRLGDMRRAVGSYHSPDRERSDRYASIVLAALRNDAPAIPPSIASPFDLPKPEPSPVTDARKKIASDPRVAVRADGAGGDPRASPAGSVMMVRSASRVLVGMESMTAVRAAGESAMKVVRTVERIN
jgi:hypothetical protein